MNADDEAAAVLSQVVELGGAPTRQELELGDAVVAHVSERLDRESGPETLAATQLLMIVSTDELVAELRRRGERAGSAGGPFGLDEADW